jgi:hypothetical protein
MFMRVSRAFAKATAALWTLAELLKRSPVAYPHINADAQLRPMSDSPPPDWLL